MTHSLEGKPNPLGDALQEKIQSKQLSWTDLHQTISMLTPEEYVLGGHRFFTDDFDEEIETSPQESNLSITERVEEYPEENWGNSGDLLEQHVKLREVQKNIKEHLRSITISNSNRSPSLERRSPLSRSEMQNPLTVTVTKVEKNGNATTIVTVDGAWTVRETVFRLQKRFSEISSYSLCVQNKRGFVALKEDRLMSLVVRKMDSAKIELFLVKQPEEKRKSRRLKSRETISSETLMDAIRRNEDDHLQFLLNTEWCDCVVDELDPQEGYAPIHAAVRSNNPKIVGVFVDYYQKHQLDINIKDRYGWTVLHHAVSTCTGTEADDKILSKLLKCPQIRVDVTNDDRNTPLHYFSQKFLSPSCVEHGEILIKKEPDTVNQRNLNGETPLHKAIFNQAVRVLMVKLLIKRGADVNIPNRLAGETALHYAVRLRRMDLVKILLHAGADIHIREQRDKKTAFELAIQFQEEEIIQMLKKVEDLYKWLQKNGLPEFYDELVKEDAYLDELATAAEQNTLDSLLDKLTIEAFGSRIRMKQACKALSEKYAEKNFELRVKQAKGSSSGTLTTEVKESLSSILHSDSESWLIRDSTELEFTELLGSGTSGKVYKGLLRGNKVAIKVFKSVDQAAVKVFKKEFAIMRVINSEYVVHFFGACLEPKICVVMEYCNRKSLKHVLEDSSFHLDWKKAFRMLLDMSRGMEFLHSKNILHRDLKSLNLLVNKSNEWRVKVADFGMARFDTQKNQSSLGKLCGTYSYMAPEIIKGEKFTEKSDVFSMAIVMWEVIFRVIEGKYLAPYKEFPAFDLDFQIALQVSEHGTRPTLPSKTPLMLRSITERCWQVKSTQRPTAKELGDLLEECVKDLKDNSSSWQ